MKFPGFVSSDRKDAEYKTREKRLRWEMTKIVLNTYPDSNSVTYFVHVCVLLPSRHSEILVNVETNKNGVLKPLKRIPRLCHIDLVFSQDSP